MLHEVTLICHRVAIIHHGRLLAIDTPAGLQQAVQQTHIVTLQVTAPPEALQTELLAVDGVDAVQVAPSVDHGSVLSVACHVGAKEGVEAAIARAVAPRWDLHRLQRRPPTLENIFLHYVDQTPVAKDLA